MMQPLANTPIVTPCSPKPGSHISWAIIERACHRKGGHCHWRWCHVPLHWTADSCPPVSQEVMWSLVKLMKIEIQVASERTICFHCWNRHYSSHGCWDHQIKAETLLWHWQVVQVPGWTLSSPPVTNMWSTACGPWTRAPLFAITLPYCFPMPKAEFIWPWVERNGS